MSNLAAIPLYTNAKERRQYDDLADLYSIIKVTEHLEKAYARDIVSADEVSSHDLGLLRVGPLLAVASLPPFPFL